jgi:hypothetical protein
VVPDEPEPAGVTAVPEPAGGATNKAKGKQAVAAKAASKRKKHAIDSSDDEEEESEEEESALQHNNVCNNRLRSNYCNVG